MILYWKNASGPTVWSTRVLARDKCKYLLKRLLRSVWWYSKRELKKNRCSSFTRNGRENENGSEKQCPSFGIAFFDGNYENCKCEEWKKYCCDELWIWCHAPAFSIGIHYNFAYGRNTETNRQCELIHDDVCFERRDRAPMINKTSSVRLFNAKSFEIKKFRTEFAWFALLWYFKREFLFPLVSRSIVVITKLTNSLWALANCSFECACTKRLNKRLPSNWWNYTDHLLKFYFWRYRWNFVGCNSQSPPANRSWNWNKIVDKKIFLAEYDSYYSKLICFKTQN